MLRRVFSIFLLIGLLALALGPALKLDEHARLGMLLTYPPRLPLASFATLLTLYWFLKRSRTRGLFALIAACLLSWQAGWGGSQKDDGEALPGTADSPTIVTLVMNVRNEVDGIAKLRELCDTREVDLLILQEVKADTRAAWLAAFTDFAFARADESVRFTHDDWEPFSSLTGLRRDAAHSLGEVDTAITDYRSFATRLQLGEQQLQVVNIHTTKPVWLQGGLMDALSNGAAKAAWHTDETSRLRSWLREHDGLPTLVAGDFNAPLGSRALRLPGFHHAHLAAGSGPHRSYPAPLFVWGLDHALGNARLDFASCEWLQLGFSDHRAQLLSFTIRPDDATETRHEDG